MFVNNKKLLESGAEVDITITEFFPSIGEEDLTVVPLSKKGGKFPFFAFGEVMPDALTLGPLDEDNILSIEDFRKEANRFLKKVSDVSDGTVDFYFDMDQMYQRYTSAVNELAIAGVSSVVIAEEGSSTEVSSDAPEFTPADGLEYKLDLESYWKSLMFVIPNIVADASTAIRMYENYVTAEKFPRKQKPYSSSMVINSMSIEELVETITKAMDKTDLESDEISKLLSNNEVEKSPEMKEYYKHMLNKHDVSQSQATGLLLYAFSDHYQKVYETGDMSHLYEEDDSFMILSLPKSSRTKRKEGGGGLLG